MNHLRGVLILVALLVCTLSAPSVRAQQGETRIGNAEVVYIEGRDVVLRLTDGEVKQLEFPDSSRFVVDGKELTVHELKPGMKLGESNTTTVAARSVDTVETIEVGTVWKTVGNNIIIKTPDGVNKVYRVPSGGRVTIEGRDISLEGLREGDKITATVVKLTATSEATNVTAHVRKTPATPARVGALLIDEGAKVEESHGLWGNTTIIIGVIALLLVSLLVFLAFWRKRKA
ncbi:MAG: hypothetical protein WB699_08010 [Bacteroidota bacterium]